MIKIISRKSDLAIIQACLVGDAIKDRKSDMAATVNTMNRPELVSDASI